MSSIVLDEEKVLLKSKASSLSDVKTISFWGAKIGNVDIVTKMPNLESASLSANNISSLRAFSCCPNLRELFVRRNQIQDLSEFDYLKNLRHLKTLWASDNPVAQLPGYRNYVIRTLPQITKLDEVDITDIERKNAQQDPSMGKSRPRLLSPTTPDRTEESTFLHVTKELAKELTSQQLNALDAKLVALIEK